jgi:transcriptional regulator with XRE-family HTH domain
MNLKRRRLELNMTQTQIAKITGLSQSILSDYETGNAQMTAQSIVALCYALECTSDYLLGLSEAPRECRKIPLL